MVKKSAEKQKNQIKCPSCDQMVDNNAKAVKEHTTKFAELCKDLKYKQLERKPCIHCGDPIRQSNSSIRRHEKDVCEVLKLKKGGKFKILVRNLEIVIQINLRRVLHRKFKGALSIHEGRFEVNSID